MNNDYRVWQDFNNISVEVKIDNIKYNSILYVENEMLKLKIDCTKNIEKFDRNINIIDIINGKILKDGTKVAFINCFHYGMQSSGIGKNEYIYSIYRIDRVFLGANLTNMQEKKISACKVVYQRIDDFFNDKIFNVNFTSHNVQIIPFCKKHKYNKDKLNFEVLSSIEENEDEGFIRMNKEIVVYLKNNKKVCFDDLIKKIYTFRNLMMILLKRNVIVKKQTFEVFKFSESEINEISKNVKDGRTYYVHYVKNGWKLSHDKLFRYYNFLEDIILLNIYKLMGINITQNEHIAYFNFCYTKQELLNREEK